MSIFVINGRREANMPPRRKAGRFYHLDINEEEYEKLKETNILSERNLPRQAVVVVRYGKEILGLYSVVAVNQPGIKLRYRGPYTEGEKSIDTS